MCSFPFAYYTYIMAHTWLILTFLARTCVSKFHCLDVWVLLSWFSQRCLCTLIFLSIITNHCCWRTSLLDDAATNVFHHWGDLLGDEWCLPPDIMFKVFNLGFIRTIFFRMAWVFLVPFGQNSNQTVMYWRMASMWPFYHNSLISGVLKGWLSFWQVLPSSHRNSVFWILGHIPE